MKSEKKYRIWELVFIVFDLLLLGFLLLILFSPYKLDHENQGKIVVSVEINAPVQKVYSYLGNSDNAKNWSSYVDHINSLNSNEYPDGSVGAKRRCFKQKNEKGIYWDEEILENTPNQKRLLSCYNLNGFPLVADGLRTEQLYQKNGINRCKLSFTLFIDPGKSSFFSEFKMTFGAYVVAAIFRKNLQNIKQILEKDLHHNMSSR